MDSGRQPAGSTVDTTDHHAYPYKNEVSLSIGNVAVDDDETPFSTPVHHSPMATPSPRPYDGGKSLSDSPASGDSSDHHSDDSRSTHVPSPVSSSKDSAVLMRRGGSQDLTTAGLDNPGFESDKASPARPLSSFGSGVQSPANGNGKVAEKAAVAGKFRTPRTSKILSILISDFHLTEAVNLELVNLQKPKPSTTTNGHSSLPTKKDTEVHIGDPYDEYFVPVNEHRKFMRYSLGARFVHPRKTKIYRVLTLCNLCRICSDILNISVSICILHALNECVCVCRAIWLFG